MDYRQLGHSGLKVSAVGLGCNNFGRRCSEEETRAVVHKALDLGVTMFDTADFYSGGLSEEFLGKALNARRKDIVLATKFGLPMRQGEYEGGASRRYIMLAVEASLRRLGTEYIDLYQLHFPDPKTPIAETLSALDTLVRGGKVRYVGSSNLNGWQLADAAWTAKTKSYTPFISAQNHYNLLDRRIFSAGVRIAHREIQAGRARAERLARGRQSGRGEADAIGRKFCGRRKGRGLCARSRQRHSRRRGELAARSKASRHRNCRRDQARASRGECRRRQLGHATRRLG
jgi:aryl-alcohol dehydrogenase-like predicted oxidoreductase